MENTKTKSLMDGLLDEMNRNRELLKQYEMIGPVGIFGATFIKADIKLGEDSIRENDVVKMLQAFAKLKENK